VVADRLCPLGAYDYHFFIHANVLTNFMERGLCSEINSRPDSKGISRLLRRQRVHFCV
jgi:hypothetical protein